MEFVADDGVELAEGAQAECDGRVDGGGGRDAPLLRRVLFGDRRLVGGDVGRKVLEDAIISKAAGVLSAGGSGPSTEAGAPSTGSGVACVCPLKRLYVYLLHLKHRFHDSARFVAVFVPEHLA